MRGVNQILSWGTPWKPHWLKWPPPFNPNIPFSFFRNSDPSYGVRVCMLRDNPGLPVISVVFSTGWGIYWSLFSFPPPLRPVLSTKPLRLLRSLVSRAFAGPLPEVIWAAASSALFSSSSCSCFPSFRNLLIFHLVITPSSLPLFFIVLCPIPFGRFLFLMSARIKFRYVKQEFHILVTW